VEAVVSEMGQHHLTDDEVRLLGLVCEGLTNREIAGRLGIDERDAGVRVSRLLEHAGLRNRIQLASGPSSRDSAEMPRVLAVLAIVAVVVLLALR
jgi:DNA-binding NarL/FixJ family response regulator